MRYVFNDVVPIGMARVGNGMLLAAIFAVCGHFLKWHTA